MSRTIEQLAIAYVRARDEHRRLKAERGDMSCEFELPPPWEWEGDEKPEIPTRDEDAPCWKGQMIETEGYYGPEPKYVLNIDPPDWCDSCKARQVVHDQLKPAQRRMAGCMAALVRAVRVRAVSP